MEKRPVGITIIAWIYILISSIGLFASFWFSFQSWPMVIIYLSLGVTAIALYMGKKWAWWVVAVLALFLIINSAVPLMLLISRPNPMSGFENSYLFIAGKLIFQSLILMLLLSKPTIGFFDFQKYNTGQRLLILFGVCVGLFIIL